MQNVRKRRTTFKDCLYFTRLKMICVRGNAHFFYKQRFFSIQPQCCLAFPWIKLHMLLRCCLIHKSIIILRHFYIYYICVQGIFVFTLFHLGIFISYLCDQLFIFIFIFIIINHIISWIQAFMFFCLFCRIFFYIRLLIFLDDNVDEECE